MKKLYTAIFLFLCYSVNAQVRFNQNFVPDTTLICVTGSIKINLGNEGTNQNWDFSNLIFMDTAYAIVSKPNASTPGYNLFPKANLILTYDSILPNLPLSQNEFITFFNSTDNSLLGTYLHDNKSVNTASILVKSKPIVIDLLEIGETFSYLIDGRVVHSDTTIMEPYNRKGMGKWKVDAKGKAKFPNSKMNVNATRFINTEEEYDTVKYILNDRKIIDYMHTKRTDYYISADMGTNIIRKLNWEVDITQHSIAQGKKPIITTNKFLDSTIFYERKTSLSEINSFITGKEEQVLLKFLTLFPVPSNGNVMFNSDKIEYVEVRDIRGALIERQKYYGNVSLPASNGLYFVTAILLNGNSKTFKVPKE